MQQPLFSLHILLSRQQYRQYSLLDVQSIFCLGEDLVGVGLEDGGRDLLAAVSGQAVEHHAVRLCGFQEAAGELEARKVPQAALALGGAGAAVFQTAVTTTSASLTPSAGSSSRRNALPYLWANISTSAAGR